MDIKTATYSNVLSLDKGTQISNASNRVSTNENTTKSAPSTQVNISELGKIHQSIDDLFSKVDDIYMSHLSKEQKSEVQNKYKELDDIFNSTNPSEASLKNADGIFNRIDELFSKAESSLTNADYKNLDDIDQKLETLLDQEESVENGVFEKIDALSEQQNSLIATSLNSKQKEELTSLNDILAKLFDKQDTTNEQDKKIDKLFNKIDNILNKAFENLSDKNKEKVSSIDDSISKLYEKLDQ